MQLENARIIRHIQTYRKGHASWFSKVSCSFGSCEGHAKKKNDERNSYRKACLERKITDQIKNDKIFTYRK